MISVRAVVESEAIGSGTRVGDFAVVQRGAILGRDVVIHPHVTIAAGVEIGDGVEVFPGAFLGKEPKGAGATARQPRFERLVRIGEGCSIGPNAVIYYDVTIGPHTLIGDGASIREQCHIGQRCIISRCVTLNYNVTVGDGTKIMDLTHITGNTVIGDDVFISVLVATTNDNAIGSLGYQEHRIQGPTILRGAMIGAGANILPRVTIGEGAVVGAGAVVTKDVPARKLVAGVPARVVRDV